MADLPTLAHQSEGPQLFTCPICLDECPKQEIFVPSGCSHEFCRECARSVVLSAVRWVYHLPSNAGRLPSADNQSLRHVASPHNIILSLWRTLTQTCLRMLFTVAWYMHTSRSARCECHLHVHIFFVASTAK